MTIYRAEPPEVETLDVEITKKPGKNLGIGFFTSNPRGMLVTDIVCQTFISIISFLYDSFSVHNKKKIAMCDLSPNNNDSFYVPFLYILGIRWLSRSRWSHTKK